MQCWCNPPERYRKERWKYGTLGRTTKATSALNSRADTAFDVSCLLVDSRHLPVYTIKSQTANGTLIVSIIGYLLLNNARMGALLSLPLLALPSMGTVRHFQHPPQPDDWLTLIGLHICSQLLWCGDLLSSMQRMWEMR